MSAPAIRKQIRLPPVFAINQSFRGNTTQQLLIPPTAIEGTIANYQSNKFKSKVVVPLDRENDRILLVDKVSGASHNLARTIRVSTKKLIDDSPLSDLTEDRWIAHPALVRLGQDRSDLSSRLQP